MSIIPIEDCSICAMPNVVEINNDFINAFSYPQICQRNGLEPSTTTLKSLSTHIAKHITSPKLALARQMLQNQATEMVNTVLEANISMQQVDILFHNVLERAEAEDDNEKYHKLVKNLTDLMKRKGEFIVIHHKVSGKADKQDVNKAGIMEMAKAAGKAIGKDRVEEIRKEAEEGGKSIVEHIFDEDYLEKILNRATKAADTDYVIFEDEEEDDEPLTEQSD